MKIIDKKTLKLIREVFTPGTRVELVKLNDPYNIELQRGSRGTVVSVDDIGTIHVSWDCGSSLGVVYGEDCCVAIKSS